MWRSLVSCQDDAVSGGVIEPGVLVGAADAGVHDHLLALQLVSGQLAGVRHETLLPGAHRALLLPGGEVPR